MMLIGNLGKDPELKELSDGLFVAKIFLATTDIFRCKDGSEKATTQWHTVIFWRALAQLAKKYLKKGSLIYVEGKILNRKYEDKMGAMKYTTEIVASQLLMLDKRMREAESKGDKADWEDLLPF